MAEDLKPLILIHGLLRTKYSMWYLGQKLKPYGFKPLLFGYPSLQKEIASHSKRLREFIRTENLEDKPLYFVTHSLGSIVLRHLSIFHGDNLNLVRAVHLGPPHRGSKTASVLARIPLVSKIMGPSFRQLTGLNLPSLPPTPAVGIIAGLIPLRRGYYGVMESDNDGVVEVCETMVEGQQDHVIVKGTHSLLTYNKAAIEKAALFLTSGSFKDKP
jgi:hypothetical protein